MLMPTEQDLKAAAVDVSHEIHVFGVACNEVNHRAIYQAWYTLARNLMDFFDTLPEDRLTTRFSLATTSIPLVTGMQFGNVVRVRRAMRITGAS